jgi:diacylglycerol kinase (ATP)
LPCDSNTLALVMRAAAVFGLGCSSKNLAPFRIENFIDWSIGMPAAAEQADVILLFGGDGTIHRHLSQLVQLALPVLIVPTGSGNDFARDLGLYRVRDSLAAWRRFCREGDNLRAVDLGVVTPLNGGSERIGEPSLNSPLPGRYFAGVAGVGLDSHVARRAGELPRWLRGHGGYAITLLPAIFRFASVPMRISTQKENTGWEVQSDRPTILAAFGNSTAYGEGMKIAPRALLNDGQLDVCVIADLAPFKLLCMFPTVYFGRHLRLPEVEYLRGTRLRVETELPLDIYADGEYVCQTPAEISVESAALRFIVHSSNTSL